MITGYSKQEFDKNALKTIENTVNAYKNYKKWFKFPQGIKGFIQFLYYHTSYDVHNIHLTFRL